MKEINRKNLPNMWQLKNCQQLDYILSSNNLTIKTSYACKDDTFTFDGTEPEWPLIKKALAKCLERCLKDLNNN